MVRLHCEFVVLLLVTAGGMPVMHHPGRRGGSSWSGILRVWSLLGSCTLDLQSELRGMLQSGLQLGLAVDTADLAVDSFLLLTCIARAPLQAQLPQC